MLTLTARARLQKGALALVVPLALGSLSACGSGSSSASAGSPASSPTSSGSSATTSTGDQSSPKAGSTVSGADFVKLMQGAAAKLTTAKVAANVAAAVFITRRRPSGARWPTR